MNVKFMIRHFIFSSLVLAWTLWEILEYASALNMYNMDNCIQFIYYLFKKNKNA